MEHAKDSTLYSGRRKDNQEEFRYRRREQTKGGASAIINQKFLHASSFVLCRLIILMTVHMCKYSKTNLWNIKEESFQLTFFECSC